MVKKKMHINDTCKKSRVEMTINRASGTFGDTHFIRIASRNLEGDMLFLNFKNDGELEKFGNSFQSAEELCGLLAANCLHLINEREKNVNYRKKAEYPGIVLWYEWYIDNSLLGDMFEILVKKDIIVSAYSCGYDVDVKCQSNPSFRRNIRKRTKSHTRESDNWRGD